MGRCEINYSGNFWKGNRFQAWTVKYPNWILSLNFWSDSALQSAGVATGSKATAKGAKKLVPALSNAWKGLVKTVKQKIAVGSEIVGNEVGAVGDIGRTTDAAGKVVPSSIKVLERTEDAIHITATGVKGKIEVISGVVKNGDTLTLRGVHIDGAGPGTSSFGELMRIARELGKIEGVKKVIIEGARRETGAAVGKIPRPFTVEIE